MAFTTCRPGCAAWVVLCEAACAWGAPGSGVQCSAGTGLATAIFGGIKDRARCSNLKTKTDGVVKARSPTQSGHSG
jgi:hypothetical protein